MNLSAETIALSLDQGRKIRADQFNYRDLVRDGGTPTKEQDEAFLAFQKVCYGEGVSA